MNRGDLRSVEAFGYRLPLVGPLAMRSGTYTEREGILVRLTDADGVVGWGEAAPLPGYSPDTLDDAAAWLGAWARGEPPLGFLPPSRSWPAHLASAPRSPSGRWALTQARTEIEARRTDRSLAEVYAGRVFVPARPRPTPSTTLALNALLLGDRREVLDGARRAVAEGYRAAKLKVGGLAPVAAAALAHDVSEVLGDIALRLDANGAWTLDEAVAFAAALDGTAVEYVEEPLAEVSALPALSQRTSIPWALDESLPHAVGDSQMEAALRAAVVKPTLEPWLAVWAYEKLSRRQPPGPVVVSSTFESGVGMRHLVALAALGDTPAGLDTYRWLADDVLERSLPLAGPTVDVAEVLAANPVRLDALTPLDL